MSERVLYAEPGARWRTIAYGPVICLAVLIAEIVLGGGVHWVALLIGAVVIALIVWMQVIAGRRHVSVEVTPTSLREGSETVDVARIEQVYPPRDKASWDDEPWEAARALGELADVPRGRKGVGLLMRDGSLVRAWAKDEDELRAALFVARPDLAETKDDRT